MEAYTMGHLLAKDTRDHGTFIPGTTLCFFSLLRVFALFQGGHPWVCVIILIRTLGLAGLYIWSAVVFEGICSN